MGFPRTASSLLLAAAVLLPASVALAQSADGSRAARFNSRLESRFKAADANGDGFVTKDEANGKMPFLYQHFSEIDSAGKGQVSLDELKAYVADRMSKRSGGSAP